MNTADISIKDFVHNLEKPSGKWYLWVSVLAIISLFGMYALVRQMIDEAGRRGQMDHSATDSQRGRRSPWTATFTCPAPAHR